MIVNSHNIKCVSINLVSLIKQFPLKINYHFTIHVDILWLSSTLDSGVRLDMTALSAVLLTLQNNTTVEVVDLQENGLGAEGGIYFMHMLKYNNYIAEVVSAGIPVFK